MINCMVISKTKKLSKIVNNILPLRVKVFLINRTESKVDDIQN